MRWKQGRRSSNVEDRRGSKIPGGAKGLGLGGIVVLVIAAFLGADPSQLLGLLGGGQGTTEAGQTATIDPANDAHAELKEFLSVVLADTEDVWNRLFRDDRKQYAEPTLVLFENAVQSACGTQDSAVGPFYCGGDHKLYLDMGFFQDLQKSLGAGGDFAQAYVIAHEVGHHVQNLLGISPEVHRRQRGLSEAEANQLSVRLELQADFFAGVWAHHAARRDLLDTGDLDEALNAASKIGDDALQRRASGRVRPDSFTHGTSDQRVRWFRHGFQTGDMAQGDTFSVPYDRL